jgi:hypothetical protein
VRIRYALPFLAASLLSLFAPQAVRADTSPLACAVEESAQTLRPAALCGELGRALGRPVTQVKDAREPQLGDAVQILAEEMHWIVARLHHGRVKVWTRISRSFAEGREALFLSRATKALFAQAISNDHGCVRLDPNGGHRMRGFDLVHPWADLQSCPGRSVEVPDPWWDSRRG